MSGGAGSCRCQTLPPPPPRATGQDSVAVREALPVCRPFPLPPAMPIALPGVAPCVVGPCLVLVLLFRSMFLIGVNASLFNISTGPRRYSERKRCSRKEACVFRPPRTRRGSDLGLVARFHQEDTELPISDPNPLGRIAPDATCICCPAPRCFGKVVRSDIDPTVRRSGHGMAELPGNDFAVIVDARSSHISAGVFVHCQTTHILQVQVCFLDFIAPWWCQHLQSESTVLQKWNWRLVR